MTASRPEAVRARLLMFCVHSCMVMMTALFFALLAGSFAMAVAGPWNSAKDAEADLIVGQFLERINGSRADLPEAALSLAIGKRGALLLAKGYGEAAPGVPASEHTLYHVGSLAKQFTAAAVLDLISRHARLRNGTLFRLDLPLADIFDGVEHWSGYGTGQHKHEVTLRHLLTMTSTLPNFTRRPPPATDPWGRIGAPELLSEVKRMRPRGWPDTFEYSNTSYFLLSEVLEEAVLPGETRPSSYHDYLRRHIFARAGLGATGFLGDVMSGSTTALPVGRRLPVFDHPSWLKGSADLVSSAADLFAWNKAFMEGRVLSPEYSALMITGAGRVSPEIYYGMGWFVEYRDKHDEFSHAGMVPGYTSFNMIAAETVGGRAWSSVTLLVNTDVPAEELQTLARQLMHLARE